MSASRLVSLSQDSSTPCLVQTILDSHSVRYKQLPASYLPQAPSARLTVGTFMFPGSRSEFNHILYLAETSRNLLTVAYSKNTVYATVDRAVQGTVLLKLRGDWGVKENLDGF